MNVFRFCGDMLHLASIIILMLKLRRSKSCVGVSCRMQEMYLIVFLMRYVDLFWNFVSLYNSMMKIFFIASTAYVVYCIRLQPPICLTYDKNTDSFNYMLYILPGAVLLGMISAGSFSVWSVLWSTSIFVEAFAILPQLLLLQRLREVENLTSNFVIAMGLYRAFYILNWIYRYYDERAVSYVAWIGGVVQTGLYLDFFYFYARAKWYGERLILPVSGSGASTMGASGSGVVDPSTGKMQVFSSMSGSTQNVPAGVAGMTKLAGAVHNTLEMATKRM